jgi:hypothetical protein
MTITLWKDHLSRGVECLTSILFLHTNLCGFNFSLRVHTRPSHSACSTLLVLGELAHTVHRDQVFPLQLQMSHLTKVRREVISTTTKTLQCVTHPAYSSLRNDAEAPREKTQNLNTGAQGIKTLTKTNCRCVSLNAE